MSGIAAVAFGLLWSGVVVLAVFVLLMYRELDRAYGRVQSRVGGGGLQAGAPMPSVLTLGPGGSRELDLNAERSGLCIVAFISTKCAACEETMALLRNRVAGDVPAVALIIGTGSKFGDYGNDKLALHWLQNPADAPERFRVTVVPTLYMLQDGVVLGSTADGSEGGVRGLLDRVAPETSQRVGGGVPA